MFDAVTSHNNIIFLYPNALYAEIEVDMSKNEITLIRGHDYPPGIKNGFNYKIEEKFHKYEYDNTCLEWEFIEIENGYALNCYPEQSIWQNAVLLKALKEL